MTPAHFGERKDDGPVRSYAALRSWSIWRARQGTFLQGGRHRRKVFEWEMQTLRANLEAMGHYGRIGHAEADTPIAKWTPDAFS